MTRGDFGTCIEYRPNTETKTRRPKTSDLSTGTSPDPCIVTGIMDPVVHVPSKFGFYRNRNRVEIDDQYDLLQSRRSVIEVSRQETGPETWSIHLCPRSIRDGKYRWDLRCIRVLWVPLKPPSFCDPSYGHRS